MEFSCFSRSIQCYKTRNMFGNFNIHSIYSSIEVAFEIFGKSYLFIIKFSEFKLKNTIYRKGEYF